MKHERRGANAALMTQKSVFSSRGSRSGVRKSRRITAESTFGAGIKEPADTPKSVCASA